MNLFAAFGIIQLGALAAPKNDPISLVADTTRLSKELNSYTALKFIIGQPLRNECAQSRLLAFVGKRNCCIQRTRIKILHDRIIEP